MRSTAFASFFALIGLTLTWAACAPGGFEGGTTSSSGAGPGSGGGTATVGAGGAGASGGGATTSTGTAGSGGCAMGTEDCDGDPANGCEVATPIDIANCGECGKVCATGDNADASCVDGVCVLTCTPGYEDCNGNPADGCESLTQTDPANCGMCGNVCPNGPSIPADCVAGSCTLHCPPSAGNCDGNAANGCETNLNTDATHCGTCAMDCMGSPCIQGACACATESMQAQQVTLDLFIMLDQSGSMLDLVNGGTKWDVVTGALQGFFADPANAGLGVGLQYFPVPPVLLATCSSDADCAFGPCVIGLCVLAGDGGPDSCSQKDYAVAAVEIAGLSPAQASSLSSSMNSHTPPNDANTPTGPALKGAIDHAKAWAMSHPSHEVAVVLATDGDPTECNPGDIFSISNLAATGLSGNPSIKTFVIGVGTSLFNMNAIASGGGTGSAYLVDTNANVVQQLEAALQSIQQNALGCEYVIPQPMMGSIDFGKVNVQYTPGGGNPVTLANVANQAACDPQTGGWYYDNNGMPTKILLCPQTCTTVQADPNAKIDILLGCDTIHD